MLQNNFNGGQTGADQAAWHAARAFGILNGGEMSELERIVASN